MEPDWYWDAMAWAWVVLIVIGLGGLNAWRLERRERRMREREWTRGDEGRDE